VKRARLAIVGLGFYEARLDGRPLAETALSPLWTPFGRRVLYDVYDVSSALEPGEHRLDVALGNGWYNPLPLSMWGRFNLRDALAVGRPCLLAKLEIEYIDGSRDGVSSDASWEVAEGPVLRNSVYLGKRTMRGARRPPLAAGGVCAGAVRGAASPAGAACGRARTVDGPERFGTAPGVFVVDTGRNFAGQVRVSLGAARRANA
jgi:alpha-L-rhamnosidase